MERFYVKCADCKFCKPELPDWSTEWGTCQLYPSWLEVDVKIHGCYSGQIDYDRKIRNARKEGCGCG